MIYSNENLPHKLNKQLKISLLNIIKKIISDPTSVYFRKSVDYKKLKLQDYPIIIKKPMDLQTLLNKVTKNEYTYLEEALDDFQLIWDNCFLYNTESSDIMKAGKILERKMIKLIKYNFKKKKFEFGKKSDSFHLLEKRKQENYLKKLYFKKFVFKGSNLFKLFNK